jgi:hypothetical protein
MVKYAHHVDSLEECATLCTQSNYPGSVAECRSFTYAPSATFTGADYTDLKEEIGVTN